MRPLFQRLSLLSFLFTLLILSGPFGCDDTTTIVVTCGDGFLDAGEECDDGNDINGDACENDCTLPVCGNRILDAGEQCDDGNVVDGDGCPASCQAETPSFCGDAAVDSGEACDTGGMSASCDFDCTAVECGDGLVNAQAGEQCEPGAGNPHCAPDCTIPNCGNGVTEDGEDCDDGGESSNCDIDCSDPDCGDEVTNVSAGEDCDTGGQSTVCDADCSIAFCGDATFNSTAGEACDDGDSDNTDACTNACELPACGDGFVQGGEACDDGDTADGGNGCSAACQQNSVCGDGIVQTVFENCDDGDTTDEGNGCSAACQQNSVCGNGVVNPLFEDCDDGNTTDNGNGCSTTCTRLGFCGDGVIQSLFEQCDDANPFQTDDCLNTCRSNVCGDGFLDTVGLRTDTCDDGNANNNDNCVERDDLQTPGQCRPSSCTDGFVDVQAPGIEQCDDGNMVNNDGCTNACFLPSCGDGVVQSGEDCDPGMVGISTPTCNANCTDATCPDGFVNSAANEQCDDGNLTDDDACSNSCIIARCGDGIPQTGAGEQCDDGNTITETACSYGEPTCDICDSDCQEVSETGNVCGDGIVDPDHEVCDDGNDLVCGTCSADCQVVTSAAAAGFIVAPDGSEIVDGSDTFTINDGLGNVVIFEFDTDAISTNVPITISGSSTEAQVRAAIVTAINGSALLITAAVVGGDNWVTLTHDLNTSLGNLDITETVSSDGFVAIGMSGGLGGDCGDGDGCATGADCASGTCTGGFCEVP